MSQSVIYQYLKAGSQTITVPSGFSNQVLVYAWGAGGGAGSGASGGGGGYAAGVVTISSGSTVVVSVGGRGGSTVGQTSAAGSAGIGNNPIVDLSGGSGANGSDPEDNDAGGSGGGGGASAVFVNGIPMIVAAGGGGGGGLGEDWAGGATAGSPGGIATKVYTAPRGQNGQTGGGGGTGGGGAGYPYGGASASGPGDDQSGASGGYGGQNYANASVTSTSLLAGSGTNPGGTTNGYYPGKSIGKAGYDGCVILVFQKLFTAWIKQAGDWKQVSSAYVKVPTTTYTTYTSTPPGSVTYKNHGTTRFTVPAGITSINAAIVGGGGAGGNGRGESGIPNGGAAGTVVTQTLSVTPGEILDLTIGEGGASVTYNGPAIKGGDGTATIIKRGASTLLSAAGGSGGQAANGTSMNGSNSAAPFNGVGGAGQFGNYNGLPGTLGSGGGGVDGSAEGKSSGRGGDGAITISYSSTPVTATVSTGGWKQIVRGWLKHNGIWQNIATPITLTSTPTTTTPTTRARINLVIATDTSSYDLLEVLNGTGLYYPGYSDITLTINAGVTVDSEDAGTPALTVNGLTSGDSLIIVNNGTILGRGGAGGAPGWLKTTTVGTGKNTTTSTSVEPASPGGKGGTALSVTYVATLENNGVIRAGGGGGGGGGISYNGAGGGKGGGGAGYGPGANAGTATAGGAGAGNGGTGGSNGNSGTSGSNGASITVTNANGKGSTTVSGSAGGAGGVGGKAIAGYAKLTVTVEGTIVGPRA